MDFFGLYVGIVEKNDDPEKLGRVKVRVPHVYGVLGGSSGAVAMDDLPWAMPLGLPAGGTPLSGGMDWLPEPGDQVGVQFLDGEPEKPVWSWMMQTQEQAKTFKLHSYQELKPPHKPQRGALTRYGHTVEWNLGSITMSTAKGYQVFLLDADDLTGQIMLRTPRAQFFQIDDDTDNGTLFLNGDFYVNLTSDLNVISDGVRFETVTGGFDVLSGWTASIDAVGSISLDSAQTIGLTALGAMNLTSSSALTLNAGSAFPITINYGSLLQLGVGGTEPYVLGTQLTTFLTSLLIWLSTHTHTSSAAGAPTSPPLVPPVGVVQPLVSELISTTIFGK